MIKTNSTTTNTSNSVATKKPVFTIPASFLAETSLSSLAKSAFVEKQVVNKKTTSLPMNKSTTTTSTTTSNNNKNTNTSSHNQFYTTTSNNTNNNNVVAQKTTSTTVKSPQTTTTTTTTSTVGATSTKNTPKKNKKNKHTKEASIVPQIALEKSPSTPKDQQPKHSEQEVLSDCEELEDRATVILLSARSKYSTTLTSPRSSVSLASSASSDDCSSEAYQSSQKSKLASLEEEEEYQANKNTSNANLKKSNQKLKKRVHTLTEEHNAALEKLSKLQEELVTLKTNFEKQLEETKTSSAKKVDILIDRTQHFKAKMKTTREELAQIEVNVIIPLRESLEKKGAEFEAIIESMKAQLKEQHDHDEISWKRILNEKELDFATKLELLQKEQQTALQTELSLRSDLEKIVQSRTEEVKSLKNTFETIQQLLATKKIEEQALLKKTKSREEELLSLLHQKELENQRIMQENAMLKKQVESLSKAMPKSVEAAEWKQQLAIPQRVEVDKSAPASLSVWRKMHGNAQTNNALRGTLANFLNKC